MSIIGKQYKFKIMVSDPYNAYYEIPLDRVVTVHGVKKSVMDNRTYIYFTSLTYDEGHVICSSDKVVPVEEERFDFIVSNVVEEGTYVVPSIDSENPVGSREYRLFALTEWL